MSKTPQPPKKGPDDLTRAPKKKGAELKEEELGRATGGYSVGGGGAGHKDQ